MKQKLFPYIIALSALSVSASAAFYSVFGLSHLFAGASMVITSGGIYGYLSGAYAETATQSEFLDKQVAIIDQKRTRFEEQRNDYKISVKELTTALSNPTMIQYVDKETGQLVTTTSSRQRKLLQSQLQEAKINLNSVTDSIANLDVLILDAQINNESARELGPLQYIATLMDRPMDQIINWFMLLIIFVFDPLAIGMVVAANMAFSTLKPKGKNEDEVKEYFVYHNKEQEKEVECSLPEGAEWGKYYSLKDNNHFDSADVDELKHWTKKQRISSMNITQEDEKRMDVIGQNGNDGLHYKEEEKNKVIKEYIKLPKSLKNPLKDAIKNARRQGKKIPQNINRFFED
jgi:hypothetical protein